MPLPRSIKIPDAAFIRREVVRDFIRKRAKAMWKPGEFSGRPRLAWMGSAKYVYAPDEPPFSYTTSSGFVITPGSFRTDAGSIPRHLWWVPNLNPWTYLPAYIIHDWEFAQHREGRSDRTFEEVNDTLAEAVFTLIHTGEVKGDLVDVQVIWRAVRSRFVRWVWEHPEGRMQPPWLYARKKKKAARKRGGG